MLEILSDPRQTGLIAVCTPEEMPVARPSSSKCVSVEETTCGCLRSWSTTCCPSSSAAVKRRFSRSSAPRRPRMSSSERAGGVRRPPCSRRRGSPSPCDGPGRPTLQRLQAGLPGACRCSCSRTCSSAFQGCAPRARWRHRWVRSSGCGASTSRPGPNCGPQIPDRSGHAARRQGHRHRLRSGWGGQDHRQPPLAATARSSRAAACSSLTVDPARRLADALGIEGIGNDRGPHPRRGFRRGRVPPRGELWAAMLDTKQSWDDLIRRHAPDPQTREQILANPLYQNISGRFVQSPRLHRHGTALRDPLGGEVRPHRGGHAAHSQRARFPRRPAAYGGLLFSRLLRWLIVPYRSRLVNMASRPFYQVADRILGTQFLADISEFFILFQSMYAGFVERADAVTRLLSDRRTTSWSFRRSRRHRYGKRSSSLAQLTARKLHLGAVVLNKVLPEYLRDAKTDKLAESIADRRRRAGRRPHARPRRWRPGYSVRWPRASSTSASWPARGGAAG